MAKTKDEKLQEKEEKKKIKQAVLQIVRFRRWCRIICCIWRVL